MSYTVHNIVLSHCNGKVQKNGAETSIFGKKAASYIIFFRILAPIFGLLTLNHCIVLRFVFVPYRFDSS